MAAFQVQFVIFRNLDNLQMRDFANYERIGRFEIRTDYLEIRTDHLENRNDHFENRGFMSAVGKFADFNVTYMYVTLKSGFLDYLLAIKALRLSKRLRRNPNRSVRSLKRRSFEFGTIQIECR